MTSPPRTLRSGVGSNQGAFGPTEWALLAVTVSIWGSSFLWIAIGLDNLHPGAVALSRTALGAFALSLLPSSRAAIPRTEFKGVAIVGVFGTVIPALLFAFAEQWVESSVAGMVQAAAPLFVLSVSIFMLRQAPSPTVLAGLALGLVGGVLLSLPNVTGADAEPLGVLLILLAVACYAVSSNIVPPLVQAYGSISVMARALQFGTLVLIPYGIWGFTQSSFAWSAVLAMTILGVFGTGLARTTFAELVSRAGAPRASLVSYLVPVIAVVLGVVFREDSMATLEYVGLAVILSAARLTSRANTT
jgi:drug/metabolite transporter (DMT)-like permease